MFKKWGSIILSVILCVSVLSGCQNNMKFDSEAEMKSHVRGVWNNDGTYYVLDNGRATRFFDWNLTGKLFELKEDETANVETLTFEEFYENNQLIGLLADIEYDYKHGKIVSNYGEKLFVVLEDGTLKYDEDILTKVSSDPGYLLDFIEEQFNAEIGKIIFDKKYPDLPSSREVQYDKWGHFGDNFIITGTAELDDYYNWGYEDYAYGYFCINIRPSGGTYSDEWYIYANRNSFSDLYASLQNGSKNVTLVAQMVYVDTGSNNMATLIDYKK